MTPDVRPYCYRCFKPASVCICASLPRVANQTHVHILQHPREQHRAIGTVRFAALGLARCSVEVNEPWTGVPSALASHPPSSAALLFPSEGARALGSLAAHERPHTLVVLDGTWHQVKALVRNNPWLTALPHVFLPTPEPSRYRIRAEPQVHYLSTLEAIVATLQHLEPETEGLPALLHAFETMIDLQIDRSTVRATRRPRQRQHKPRHAPPEFSAHANRHVVLHVETVGPLRTSVPLQACALRVATGERFECLAVHDLETDAPKGIKLGLDPLAFLHAVNEPELHARWRAFLHPDDVVLAWHQRALDVLVVPDTARLLKADWCNLDHRKAGHLADLLRSLGLESTPQPFHGRAALHVGDLLAIRAELLRRSLP